MKVQTPHFIFKITVVVLLLTLTLASDSISAPATQGADTNKLPSVAEQHEAIDFLQRLSTGTLSNQIQAAEEFITQKDERQIFIAAAIIGAYEGQETKKRIFNILVQIENPNAINVFKKLLASDTPPVRALSAAILAEKGDSDAKNELIKAININDYLVASGVSYVIGEMRLTDAVNPLIAAIRKGNNVEFRAKALKAINDPKTVPILVAIATNTTNAEWRKAVEALGYIGNKDAVEQLIALLKALKPRGRNVVAEALGRIGDARAVKPLQAALKEEKGYEGIYIISALTKICTDESVRTAMTGLTDSDPFLRKNTAYLLWTHQCFNPAAIPPLIAALKDSNPEVRQTAIAALFGQKAKEAIPELKNIAENDKDPAVREKALNTYKYLSTLK